MTGGRQGTGDATSRQAVILVIDDDPNNLALMVSLLGDSRLTVLVAEDGESGVQRAAYACPDLILLDVMMPGIDGYETCRALKALWATRDIPVLFMTALTETEYKVRGFEVGAVDYITKPFHREEVLARIGVQLRIRELTEGLKEANEVLERRVRERTLELARANEDLLAEVAEHRQTEKALARSRKYLDQVINAVADPIFVKDRQHRWVLLNDACCNLIGHTREELVCKTDYDFFPTSEADEFWRKDELVFLSGVENVNEEQITDSEGKVRTIVTKKTRYEDEAGERFIVGVIRDVTDHRDLEEQLRHAQKMEAVGTLAGGVAHDFNNMLTAINGYASLVRLHAKDDSPLQRHADGIVSAAERAAGLTHSLLSFSRKRVCNRQPVDLNKIVEHMERFLERVLGDNIEIETCLSPCELIVMADCGQVEQLLVNTATNARDAMPGGGKLTIRTEQLPHGCDGEPCALLTIQDTGTGMDEETRARIFEPFFTTKEEGKGTGLGLAIVYGIVKQHEGRIRVQSKLGQGTSLGVTLALVKPTAIVTKPDRLPPARGGTETVLVAEDDRDVRQFVKTLLEEFGYSVLLAEDGEEALRLYKQRGDEVDLLLLDEVMPRRNGSEVLAEISRTTRDRPPPTIFVSGYAGNALVTADMGANGIKFIQKPLTVHLLLAMLRELLDEPATASS